MMCTRETTGTGVSRDTKSWRKMINEGRPSSMVYHTPTLGSGIALEPKAQGSALLQSSPGKRVQLLPAKPCSESPKIWDTALSALPRASTARGLSRWVKPLGASS